MCCTFFFLIKKKLCSVCLVTELCQERVAAEIKIVALNRLVFVLGTDSCISDNGIRVTEEMCAGNLNCIYCTSGTLCCTHVPLLNGSDPLAAGFIIKNAF